MKTDAANHRPTFKQSSERRPLLQRVTPQARVLVAVVLVSIVACAGAGVWALFQDRERPLVIPPTATPAPTTQPTATAGPSPTATSWHVEMVTPTVGPTATMTPTNTYPAWWVDDLYWDEDGYVIVYKRLEEGVFRFPAAGDGAAGVTLRAAELAMLLDGVDWQEAKRSHRYRRPAAAG